MAKKKVKENQFKVYAIFPAGQENRMPETMATCLRGGYACEFDFLPPPFFARKGELLEFCPGPDWMMDRPPYSEVAQLIESLSPLYYEIIEYNYGDISRPPGGQTVLYYFQTITELVNFILKQDSQPAIVQLVRDRINLIAAAADFYYQEGGVAGVRFVHSSVSNEFRLAPQSGHLAGKIAEFVRL